MNRMIIILAMIFLLSSVNNNYSEEKKKESILDGKVAIFEMENQPIEKGLRTLAKDYGLRFGFESREDQKQSEPPPSTPKDIKDITKDLDEGRISVKEARERIDKLFAKDDEQLKKISVQLKDTTIREILNALVKADGRFNYEEKGVIVNVIQKGLKDDDSYMLNRKIDTFSVKNKNEYEILNELNKIEGVELLYLPWGQPPPLSFSLNNITLREILNTIAIQESNCWFFCDGGITFTEY